MDPHYQIQHLPVSALNVLQQLILDGGFNSVVRNIDCLMESNKGYDNIIKTLQEKREAVQTAAKAVLDAKPIKDEPPKTSVKLSQTDLGLLVKFLCADVAERHQTLYTLELNKINVPTEYNKDLFNLFMYLRAV